MAGQTAEYFGKHHSYLLPQDNYYTRKIPNVLRDTLSFTPESSILEVGCGAGRFSLPLVNQGFSMTCVDPAGDLTDVFRKSVPENKKVNILTNDVFDLKGKFDFVIGFFVLHHFWDQAPLFNKFKELLKPGGKIGFVEPNPFNPLYYLGPLLYEGISNRDEYYFMVEKNRIQQNLNASGFKDIQVEKFGFLPPQILNLKSGPALDRWTQALFPRLCEQITASS